jgi:hypothetical protein
LKTKKKTRKKVIKGGKCEDVEVEGSEGKTEEEEEVNGGDQRIK